MFSAFVRLPPRIMLVILGGALALVIYHLVSLGRLQPLWLIVALGLAIGFVRTVWRLWYQRDKRIPSRRDALETADTAAHLASHGTYPSVVAVPADLQAAPGIQVGAPPPAVVFQEVSKAFGKVQALRGVTFTIPQGQVVALLGPNGAGKTTAISIMLGLRHASHGQVRLLGLDPHDRHARTHCGIMLQESGVPPTLTVHETIDLFRSYYPHPLPLAAVIAMAGLDEKISARAGALSGGQRQRLYFALAVCGDPDVLFLDEPTAGLDVEARHRFWEQIRTFVQRGKTILLTTQYLEEADALAERVILIDHGQVRADASPAELKAQVTTHHVSFEVNEVLPATLLQRLPIRQLEVSDHHVTFVTPQLETVLRSLFNQPVEISELAINGASLEEAILHLTHAVPAEKGA